MLFGFISVKHIISFFNKVAVELENFAQRVEAKAFQKQTQAADLTAQADEHLADADAARALIAKLTTATTAPAASPVSH